MTNPLIERLLADNAELAEYLSDFWVDDLEMLIVDYTARKSVADRFGVSPATVTRLCEHYIPLADA